MFDARLRLLYISPRYSCASPFDTRPRREPMRIGRCSIHSGHWFSQAPHVVHCQSSFSCRPRQACDHLARQQRLLRLQDHRLRVQLLARAPGRAFTLQRPHSTHVNASSTLLASEILHRLEADLFLLEIQVRQIASSGDFRNTVNGDNTRWKCFEAGISARNARITSM